MFYASGRTGLPSDSWAATHSHSDAVSDGKGEYSVMLPYPWVDLIHIETPGYDPVEIDGGAIALTIGRMDFSVRHRQWQATSGTPAMPGAVASSILRASIMIAGFQFRSREV